MTKSPLLALALCGQACFAAFLPDTGLSVRALGYTAAGSHRLQVRLQNASRSSKSALEIRFVLTGDSVDLADFALRTDLAVKYRADGFQATADSGRLDSTLRACKPRPAAPGCDKNCQMTFSVALPNLVLGPFETFRWDLVQNKRLPSGELENTAPTHPITTGDWSFSGIPLDSAEDDPYMEMGSGPLASRIQILSNGAVLWGTAPGEPEPTFPSPWKRQGLSTTIDAIKTPFADSVPQRVRDSANLAPSRLLVNQAGYRTSDVQAGRAWIKAIGTTTTAFSVIDENGAIAARGTLANKHATASGQYRAIGSNWAGSTSGGDHSYTLQSPVRSGDLMEGRIPSTLPAGGPYRIVAGADTSARFRVDDRLYGWLRDAALRFFGAQRSGNSESWMHGPSHVEDVAAGGWYDCGNHLKEGVTQGYALSVLGSMATAYPERDADRTAYSHDSMRVTDGVPDVLRELEHGTDFAVDSWLEANRTISGTINSVGNLGKDYSAWFPADWSDVLPLSRGGQASRTGFVDSGAGVQASFAAGLAFFAKAWEARNPNASAEALEMARSLYAAAKAKPTRPSNSPDYSSSSRPYGSLALAATALLVATKDTSFLRDLAYDTTLGKPSIADSIRFKGGWLARVSQNSSTLGYADLGALALFQFHRLVLRDSTLARLHGVRTEKERSFLELRTGLAMGSLMTLLAGGSGFAGNIPIPSEPYTSKSISYDTLWHTLPQPYGVSGWWNQYQMAGVATLLLYSEIAADLQGRNLPYLGASADWNAAKTMEIALRSMDEVLGVNPWDLSFVFGVGSKGPNHPNHRTANPDGRTLPFPYTYQVPTGALYAGQAPSISLLTDSYSVSYTTTESCLEGSANLLIPSMILSFDAGPTSSIGDHDAPRPSTPDFVAKSTKSGVKVVWSRAHGSVEIALFDLSGRVLANSTAAASSGSTEFVVSRTRGPLLARLRDARSSQTLVLPGL